MPNILIADTDKAFRKTVREALEHEGYKVDEAENGLQALEALKNEEYDAALYDSKLPKKDVKDVLAALKKEGADTQLILLTDEKNADAAVEIVRKGAFNFLTKPIDWNHALVSIRNAVEKNSLLAEAKILKRKAGKTREIIGDSPAIQKIKNNIERVAPTDARVLITGEKGTGKELIARWIHEKSNRANKPMEEINCASIPAELIESELFGHEKGAFPSAIKTKQGKFELANEGTVYIDEINDLPLSVQTRLLRAIQENRIQRVGSDKDIPVDVRVIAATHKDLTKEIEEGRFRAELYSRLSTIIIHVPTLNERADDIPLLAEKFVREICEDYSIPKKAITPKALEELKNMKWQGNIRELRNVVERLIILSEQKITEEDVKSFVTNIHAKNTPTDIFEQFEKFQDFKEHMEKLFIEHMLKKHAWNVSKTADVLDIQRSHLYNKIEKFDLKRN